MLRNISSGLTLDGLEGLLEIFAFLAWCKKQTTINWSAFFTWLICMVFFKINDLVDFLIDFDFFVRAFIKLLLSDNWFYEIMKIIFRFVFFTLKLTSRRLFDLFNFGPMVFTLFELLFQVFHYLFKLVIFLSIVPSLLS